MFHDPDDFSFTRALENHWQDMLSEFRQIASLLKDWEEDDLFDKQWQVYPLFEFPGGEPIEKHCSACPISAALINEHCPKHGTAGFSVLQPQTNVFPHEGLPGEFLRYHLGLEIPTSDHDRCGLEVLGERRSWAAGKSLVFDDRVTHSAWNRTDEPRVILLVDFIPGP